eukprot:GHVP01026610.1.p1 GENE.GHVP01026610.1~~GHVP01026610.1.p1  ORF type:complete len:301 (+),score=49.73 GHVP01026610.1:27-905(+)
MYYMKCAFLCLMANSRVVTKITTVDAGDTILPSWAPYSCVKNLENLESGTGSRESPFLIHLRHKTLDSPESENSFISRPHRLCGHTFGVTSIGDDKSLLGYIVIGGVSGPHADTVVIPKEVCKTITEKDCENEIQLESKRIFTLGGSFEDFNDAQLCDDFKDKNLEEELLRSGDSESNPIPVIASVSNKVPEACGQILFLSRFGEKSKFYGVVAGFLSDRREEFFIPSSSCGSVCLENCDASCMLSAHSNDETDNFVAALEADKTIDLVVLSSDGFVQNFNFLLLLSTFGWL